MPKKLDKLSIVHRGVRVPMLGSYNPVEHGVTISILGDFLECREKPKFRVNRVQSRAPSLPLTFGHVGHEILKFAHEECRNGKLKTFPSRAKVQSWCDIAEEKWRKENPAATSDALQQLELSLGFIEAVMPMYFDLYKKSLFEWEWFSIEDWFEVSYPIEVNGQTVHIPIKGKLDGGYTLEGLNYVFESKFKYRYDTAVLADLLELDLQVRVYMYCASVYYDKPINGLLYNLVRRPNLRQGKKEKFDAFIKRCVEDAKKRPDFYFHRLPLSFTEEEINEVEFELDNLLKDFYLWSIGQVGDYKNPAACETKYGTCSFLPICSRGDWSGHMIKEKPDATKRKKKVSKK